MADFAVSDNIEVQKQLDRISLLSPGRDVLGLERIRALMLALDNPHLKLPPVFHIAGTNGKGSTCAFLRAAIEAAGLKAHVYSSPHLLRFNERIRVAGQLITDEALAAALAKVLDAAEAHQLSPSFFEVTTAAAFLIFSQTPADISIIEVGLGGRLDATNIIEKPVICAIASLGIDHEGFLLSPEDGTPKDPLNRIGWEKAGIAKNKIPLVISHYDAPITSVIADHAQKVDAPLFTKKQDWDAVIYDGQLHYRDEHGKIALPLPRMNGPHQSDNAALAIAILRHQNAIKVPESALAAAMEWAHWPARLQFLDEGPLTAINLDIPICLDGGHNANAGLALAEYFNAKFPNKEKRLHLIIAMLANKDPKALIKPLAPYIKSITMLPIKGHEHHEKSAFEECAAPYNISVTRQESITEALQNIKDIATNDMILIAGTLYLAGEVLSTNHQIID